MKIAQLTPGSGGGFYCENCLRDAALVRAMRKAGHDVVLIPMYLPMLDMDPGDIGEAPIFFGGVNVYLQQKSKFFRHTPRWIDRMLDSQSLLKKISKHASMTSSSDLGNTTVSMLKGKDGKQVKELERLIKWLSTEENRPDLVCLSNIMLAGLAQPIREALDVPVVCLLQDEDGFLDGLDEPYKTKAWDILAERSKDVDGFIAVSEYYADKICERLELDESRVEVVYTGIELDDYEPVIELPKYPTIGFLSQMCSAKGLDTLIEAFVILRKDARLANLKVRVAGGSTAADGSWAFCRALACAARMACASTEGAAARGIKPRGRALFPVAGRSTP